MVKLIIERENGSKTVIENVIDWSYWTTEDVRDYLNSLGKGDNTKINLTDEQFKELCEEIHRQIFKYYSVAITEEEFHNIIDEILKDLKTEELNNDL